MFVLQQMYFVLLEQILVRAVYKQLWLSWFLNGFKQLPKHYTLLVIIGTFHAYLWQLNALGGDTLWRTSVAGQLKVGLLRFH